MSAWYIGRGGQQYGPYEEWQLLEMNKNGQLLPEDLFQMAGGGWMTLQQALPYWQSVTPDYRMAASAGKPRRPKKKHGCLIAFLIVVLVVASAVSAFSLLRRSDVIESGRSYTLAKASLGKDGGTLTVDNPGDELDGMCLEVPAGAYEKTQTFKITARPVTSHQLGKEVELLTPVISIDNHHAFSKEPMTLTIPIHLEEGRFAMGFYYNSKTGALEGIPFSELNEDHITLVTCHFSDLVVASTDLSSLMQLSADTSFRPGLDDWQFENRGSSICPDGHCAGQSLTAMFYDTNICQEQGEPHLYGRFDNNLSEFKTPSFDFDDSWGWRFASVIQKELAWDSYSRKLQMYAGKGRDPYTFAAFAFAMQLTGEPQFVCISGLQSSGGTTISGSHAVIAYRIENCRIYVADPNYPGQSDRFIVYDPEGTFMPYSSGANAQDIASGASFLYTKTWYLAKTSLIDYDLIQERYKDMLKGQIGQDLFPDYQIEYLSSVDPKTGKEKWVTLKDELKLTSEDTEKAGKNLKGKLRLRFSTSFSGGMTVTVFEGYPPELQGSQSVRTQEEVDFTLNKTGVLNLGFLIMHQEGAGSATEEYTDFKRVRIEYENQADIMLDHPPRVLCGQESVFSAKVKGGPAEAEYRWDFGDGKDPIVTNEPVIRYAYEKDGHYALTLTLIDKKTNKTVGEANSPVEALDLFGTWQLRYTIEEAGMIDTLLNKIINIAARFFAQIFETEVTDEISISIEGTVVDCKLDVLAPEETAQPIQVRLQHLNSSTDFIKVTDEIATGTLTFKDDEIVIVISAEGLPAAMTFRGTLTQGILYGEMKSAMFSGHFQAVR